MVDQVSCVKIKLLYIIPWILHLTPAIRALLGYEPLVDDEQMLQFTRVVILRVVDSQWTDHMDAMNQLRDAIQLRGYGQLNPLIEYQNEGFRMFEEMIAGIEYDATRLFMKSEIRQNLRA